MEQKIERIAGEVLAYYPDLGRYEIYSNEDNFEKSKPWLTTVHRQVFLNFRAVLVDKQS